MPSKKIKFTIGIDEVGRGALAGPVVVAAVAAPVNSKFNPPAGGQNSKLKLKDSKKLSPKQREIWFSFIKCQKIPYAIAGVSPKIIDKINVSNAANLAAGRAFKKLIKNYKFKTENCGVFLDGGLHLKIHNSKFIIRDSIVKGDEKIPAISLASVAAKVYRDKLMKRLHKKHPRYDFVRNVGYGTKKHIEAIRKLGRLKIHRRSFKI